MFSFEGAFFFQKHGDVLAQLSGFYFYFYFKKHY